LSVIKYYYYYYLDDNDCGISVSALRFVRKVEVYQWRESSRSETTRNTGGSSDTKTTYTYKKDWAETLIDSKKFKRGKLISITTTNQTHLH